MQIDGRTQVLGILGKNVEHTLSPIIHNTSAEYLGINAVYVPLSLDAPEILKETIRFVQASKIRGLSVTAPYKRRVAELMKSTFDSVNTLYRNEHGSLMATSTDGKGFWRGLDRLNIDKGGIREVIFLGGGGVVSAIATFLCNNTKLDKVFVLRRDGKNDQAVRKSVGSHCPLAFRSFSPRSLSSVLGEETGMRILVQATPAPRQGDDLREFCTALDNFRGVVVDLIYDHPSKLYFYAMAKGIPVQDGSAMLVEQARLAQELWWGKSAPYEPISQVLFSHLKHTTQTIDAS